MRRIARQPWLARPGRRRCGLALVLTALCAGLPATAQVVPEDRQVPIFFKLLTYDRGLRDADGGPLRIGILHNTGDDASRRNADAFAAALGSLSDKTIGGRGFTYALVPWTHTGELAKRVADAEVDVLYVTAGHAAHIDAVEAITGQLDVLTLGARADYVEAGLSIGLGLADDRPQIIVNLGALRREGHRLDARVLRLCRVVAEP